MSYFLRGIRMIEGAAKILLSCGTTLMWSVTIETMPKKSAQLEPAKATPGPKPDLLKIDDEWQAVAIGGFQQKNPTRVLPK